MLRKIYKELAAIRKELQSIHRTLEFAGNQTKMVEKTNVSIRSATPIDWSAALDRLEKISR